MKSRIFGSYTSERTKKGPGRVANKSFRKSGSKLHTQSAEHKVGLKNKHVSLIDLHFMEKSIGKFLNK